MSKNDETTLQSGFLLTRNSQDIKKNGVSKLVITLWLKTKRGIAKLSIEDEQAVFFVETSYTEQAKKLLVKQNISLKQCQPLALKTFNQQTVSALYFSTLRDFYLARDCLKQQQIKCYEDDIRPDDRYLMERFITADIHFIGDSHFSNQNNKALNNFVCFENVKCKAPKEKANQSLSMLSLDIECSMQGDLYSIGFYSESFKCVLMIGEIEDKSERLDDHDYIQWLDDEYALLTTLIDLINEQNPDIIIGWNVINFDFDLLQKRCDLHKIKFIIGRDGSTPYWRKNKNSEQQFIEIAGRVILDGIDGLKNATYNFPSFSLDNVANTLLGIGKKVDDVENRVAEITDNFNNNKSALAAYNLEDCRLVWLIFEKIQLLDFVMLRSQLTGLAIDRVGGSVAAFTNLYLPKLHRSGYIAPNMGDGESDLISPGGFVMDSIPGLFDNVLVLDFKSLYPSIIRTFKIDPMGLIEGLKAEELLSIEKNKNNENNIESEHKAEYKKSVIAGFDGAYFSRDKHFLPEIIENLWRERDKAKKEKNAALSQAIKIIMNSFYGILGSTGCRFFDPRLSGSITKRSHEILKTTKQWIESEGYQVIYGDTDSIFVHINIDKKCSEKQALTQSRVLGKELQTLINEKWQRTLRDRYFIDCDLEIEFETHFSKFLMPTIRGQDVGTKKRYAGLVLTECEAECEAEREAECNSECKEKSKAECDIEEHADNETKFDQKIIFKGLESVRTDWTQLAKDFQQTLYHKVFNQLPVVEFIKETVAKTLAGEFDHQLIYRKRIRRKLSHYVKNVPPHVKAARLADDLNEKQGKPLRYQNRGWIEYFITLNGPQTKEHLSSPLDYQFYIDRQLTAVADAILPFIGTSFSEITDKQLNLFS